MSATQETQRLHFGSARLWGATAGGIGLRYDKLQEVDIDFSTTLKEAFSEGNYAFATADGQRSISITGKHYMMDLASLAVELGGSAPAANSVGYVIDEAGAVPATSTYTYTLTHSATATAPVSIIVGVTTSGITNPVSYSIVAAGSEVAGASCSYAAGVLTFAVGDAGSALKVTYEYGVTTTGLVTNVVNTFQNSAATFALTCVKRDLSRLGDGSTAYFAYEFAAVRSAGVKAAYKEGDYTVYERSFKAYADPMGNVLKVRELNA